MLHANSATPLHPSSVSVRGGDTVNPPRRCQVIKRNELAESDSRSQTGGPRRESFVCTAPCAERIGQMKWLREHNRALVYPRFKEGVISTLQQQQQQQAALMIAISFAMPCHLPSCFFPINNIHCRVSVFVSRSTGITRFDLLGDFGRFNWLGNFYIVLSYNLLFAVVTTLCLVRKFTSAVREELLKALGQALTTLYFPCLWKNSMDGRRPLTSSSNLLKNMSQNPIRFLVIDRYMDRYCIYPLGNSGLL